jgi:hypothetical protein
MEPNEIALPEELTRASPEQKADYALGRLGLDYGEGYGCSYFTAGHRHALVEFFRRNPDCKSLPASEDIRGSE